MFPEILSSTQLLSSPLHPAGILVVGVDLVTLALGDILDRGALTVDTIARAYNMVESYSSDANRAHYIVVNAPLTMRI